MEDVKFVKEEGFNTIINGKIPCFVEFWSYDCMACELANPFLFDLAEGYKEKLIVVKVDAKKYISIMKKYIIHVWPTFIMFKSGKPLFEIKGFGNTLKIEKQIRLNLN